MRERSTYETECLCGERLESESNVMTCPKCGRVIEIQFEERAARNVVDS